MALGGQRAATGSDAWAGSAPRILSLIVSAWGGFVKVSRER
jgi:hypothetical protein